MSLKAVLFDLDGTLLPMDQNIFVKAYFKGLAEKLAPFGFKSEELIKAIWGGTTAMINNCGETTNEEVFWQFFEGVFGKSVRNNEPVFTDFYKNEFQKVKSVCGFDPFAVETVRRLKISGIRSVLATNPIFPAIATQSRIRWAGLEPEDFELYTTYENICYCKPNRKYYLEIANRLNVLPEDCLMVGNDVDDDMVAQDIGMKTFLLTDNLINQSNRDISQFEHGGFEQLNDYIARLIK
ncbi:MAG: HAD hydrolase-like protein [bacterium]|nr:HAD hydrolase-like protein [bacterium]